MAVVGVVAAGVLLWARRGCRHDVRTVPLAEEQTCLVCGSHRRFVSGEKPGPWQRTKTLSPAGASLGDLKKTS
jgi:hypothetical protein